MRAYQPDVTQIGSSGSRDNCFGRLELMKPFVDGTVLDIGCNEGFFCFGLVEQADEVVGIDADKGMISRCKQRHATLPDHLYEKVRFIHTELEYYMTRGHRFNTTLYLSVHHHIMAARGFEAAAEILFRVMENTGTLFFDIGQKDERSRGGCQWWHMLPKGNPDKWVRGLLAAAGALHVVRIGESKVAGTARGLWQASR